MIPITGKDDGFSDGITPVYFLTLFHQEDKCLINRIMVKWGGPKNPDTKLV